MREGATQGGGVPPPGEVRGGRERPCTNGKTKKTKKPSVQEWRLTGEDDPRRSRVQIHRLGMNRRSDRRIKSTRTKTSVTPGFRRQTECEPCTCQDQLFHVHISYIIWTSSHSAQNSINKGNSRLHHTSETSI
jgi:hypothetical protein